MLDGLKCLLIHSQFSLEDRSSIFVHDSYEGPRGIVFLVFLVPGDSKCLWYYGSITINHLLLFVIYSFSYVIEE